MFRNNTCEINLLECVEKEDFKFEALGEPNSETTSAAGQTVSVLQKRTVNRLMNTRK